MSPEDSVLTAGRFWEGSGWTRPASGPAGKRRARNGESTGSTVPDTAGVNTIASPTKAATDPKEAQHDDPLVAVCHWGSFGTQSASACLDSARRWLPVSRKISGKAPATVVRCAPNPFVRASDLGSKPPALHDLQADPSAQQRGISRVVPESARRQVKPVDEGRALVENIDNSKIGLGIGEPARAAGGPVADINIDRRPRIHLSLRDRGGIAVSAGVIHRALDGPALERPRQIPDQPQARRVTDGIHQVHDRRGRGYLLLLVKRIGAVQAGAQRPPRRV